MFSKVKKTEEATREEKSAIWPILCCGLFITVVSNPPISMYNVHVGQIKEKFILN